MPPLLDQLSQHRQRLFRPAGARHLHGVFPALLRRQHPGSRPCIELGQARRAAYDFGVKGAPVIRHRTAPLLLVLCGDALCVLTQIVVGRATSRRHCPVRKGGRIRVAGRREPLRERRVRVEALGPLSESLGEPLRRFRRRDRIREPGVERRVDLRRRRGLGCGPRPDRRPVSGKDPFDDGQALQRRGVRRPADDARCGTVGLEFVSPREGERVRGKARCVPLEEPLEYDLQPRPRPLELGENTAPALPNAIRPRRHAAVRPRQVPQFVREHAAEFRRAQCAHQRSAEHEIVAVPPQEAEPRDLSDRCVELVGHERAMDRRHLQKPSDRLDIRE